MKKKDYRTINKDSFPSEMEISFVEEGRRQSLVYEKVTWPDASGEPQGLRYGENPDQKAAMYKLVGSYVTETFHTNKINGLKLGDDQFVGPNLGLVCDAKLIQSGKHPGKINMTDIDAALLILRYLADDPACAIMKHNNPCGVSQAGHLDQAFSNALDADRVAAFGGAVVLGRPCDCSTAELVSNCYVEVVAASSYEEGAVEILSRRKNLRIIEIPRMDRLSDFQDRRFLEIKSLLDGGLIVQPSFVCLPSTLEDLKLAEAKRKDGTLVKIERKPTEAELRDLLFGWFVESGVTSNSVIYVKNRTTLAIGTGEQDRVGVARIALQKARRNTLERIAFYNFGVTYDKLIHNSQFVIKRSNSHLDCCRGAIMISDAFFPFDDGVKVGLEAGVAAVAQPGGSINDASVIDACNEYGATMVFTGQRAFKH